MTSKITVPRAALLLGILFIAACAQENSSNQTAAPAPAGQGGGAGGGFGIGNEVSAVNAIVVEGNNGATVAVIDVQLASRSFGHVSVQYFTKPQSAAVGSDFARAKGALVFAPGETVKTVELSIAGDVLDEHNETFLLQLASIEVSVATPEVLITIEDDDASPALSVQSASVAEGDVGTSELVFDVALDNPSGKTVKVDYSTVDASAVAPDDYVAQTGQLIFTPGQVSATVTVEIVGDAVNEQDETFDLVLTNGVNASLGLASAEGTILDDDAPVSGLSQRPENLTCVAPDAPTVAASITDTRVFRTLDDFTKPLAMTQLPDDPTHWYMVEQDGMVYRFENVNSPATQVPVIDLTAAVDTSSSESGLLGIAIHPDFANNGFVYLSYTATGPDASSPLTSRLSRFHSDDGGVTLDGASEVVLLSLDQPRDFHNGGHIVFGPDGYLYMGFGDGGGDAATEGHRSQNTKNLFGSVLRIDVDGGSPYAIPGDNPFAGNALCDISVGGADAAQSCPEIFAWGFRNPWRFTFDRATGQLWLGDVGEHDFEEVNIVEAGGNYGWNVVEGNACFEPAIGCDTSELIPPIVTYDHSVGMSITGGFVYRGAAIPELYGRYVFVDFVTQVVFATSSNPDGTYGYEILMNSRSYSSLAEDEDGELYGVRYGNGRIHQFIEDGGVTNNTIPDNLADTGCVEPLAPQTAASGSIPYEPIATFWSDNAVKDRYYSIPDGLTVDVAPDGDWLFPAGTVLMKHFRLNDQLIETRLFMRHMDTGEWAGYTYEWNDAETEALRVVGGKTRDVGGQTWIYPSETQCLVCHTEVASSSLGLEHLQLNKDLFYPSSGLTGNQLTTADAIDILTDPLPDTADNLPALADPSDTSAALDVRARSYLHTNCAGCHRPAGPTPANIDLRFETAFSDTNTCDVLPGSGYLGLLDPRIIAPGDSGRSVLVNRVGRRDAHGMPPLGSNVVDTAGVALLTAWVDSLSVCP